MEIDLGVNIIDNTCELLCNMSPINVNLHSENILLIPTIRNGKSDGEIKSKKTRSQTLQQNFFSLYELSRILVTNELLPNTFKTAKVDIYNYVFTIVYLECIQFNRI